MIFTARSFRLRHTPVWACLSLALLITLPVTPAHSREGVSAPADLRNFRSLMTEAERKLPQSVVLVNRRGAGLPVPRVVRKSVFDAGDADPRTRVAHYRVDGSTTESVIAAMRSVGLEPEFVPAARPYATVYASPLQLAQLAEDAGITKIRKITGPKAQGVTEAYTAHGVAALAAEDPPLRGSDVVIGLISLPFSQSAFNALQAESPRVIPLSASIDLLTGSGRAAIVSQGGSADALSMLQLIYDMAPAAKVVIGSPGVDSTPGQMAALIDYMVAGDAGAGVDPVNIIVDDLYYASENPFEVGEVGEAIAAASEAGVLYISAAGDGGQYASSTSSVYFANLDSTAGSSIPASVSLDPFLSSENIHAFANGSTDQGLLQVTEAIADLCFYSSEISTAAFPKTTVWVYDESDAFVGSIENDGCLSADDPGNALPLAAGSSVVVLDNGASEAYRLMLKGERASVPTGLALTGSVFNLNTPGNVLGHAYAPEALTVGAAALCTDSDGVVAYSDATDCATQESSVYSADGELSSTARFYWEFNEQGQLQALATPVAASKPNLAAAGVSGLKLYNGSSVVDADYTGTSGAAATMAGLAALLWEYRDESATGVVLVREVAAALRDASIPAPDGDAALGAGVFDAPRVIANGVFEEPLAPENVTLETRVGGGLLSFDKAIDDLNGDFRYAVVCSVDGAADDDEPLFDELIIYPGDSSDGDAGVNKSPVFVPAPAATAFSCSVKPRKAAGAEPHEPSIVTVSGSSAEAGVGSVTMTPKAGGVAMEFTGSNTAGADPAIYTATCTAGGAAIAGWTDRVVAPNTEYAFQAVAGTQVSCSVISTVTSEDGVEYVSDPVVATGVAQVITAPVVRFQADAGGVSVSYTVDGSLLDSSMVTLVLTCSEAASNNVVINAVTLDSNPQFFVATPGVALSCSATYTITINGVAQSSATTAVVSVTPDEETQTGIPIWLLYQAKQ